jgi:hypothetical protein
MKINSSIKLPLHDGEFRAVVTRNKETIQDTGWFRNMITDSGLNSLGRLGALITTMRVGVGTNAVDANQSNLSAPIAACWTTSAGTTKTLVAPYSSTDIIVGSFAQGAVVGNITEMGCFSSGFDLSANDAWNRALITDSNGVPMTLTVTAIDQLSVYYKVSCTANTTVNTGSFVINGVTYNYSVNLGNVNNFMTGNWSSQSGDISNLSQIGAYFDADISAVSPTMTDFNIYKSFSLSNVITPAPYVANSFSRTYNVTLGPSVVPPVDTTSPTGFAHINAFYMRIGGATYFITLDKGIPKTDSNTLSFSISCGWGRG